MGRVSTCIFSGTLFLAFLMVNSQEEQLKRALVQFMAKLSPKTRGPNFGWNLTSDPCKDKWSGVSCDSTLLVVRKIVLDQFNLIGILDVASLCNVTAISVLSLNNNHLGGGIPSEISNCRVLTHLYLSGNRFSGSLPLSLPQLGNLKRIDVSYNDLSGPIPDLSRISGLLTFLAENNQLSGGIPNFDFSNLVQFNVSNNNLSGSIPNTVDRHFGLGSFSGNPQLCGGLFSNQCPQPPPPPPPAVDKKSKRPSKSDYLIYSGYGILGLALVLLVVTFILYKRKRAAERENTGGTTSNKTNIGSSREYKTGGRYKSEYSMTSCESGKNSSSLVVFRNPAEYELKFDDLLKSPAELVGRGKYGSLFKVILYGGLTMAVKRIKNVGIPREDFKKQMKKVERVKHPNLLPIVAYYCSEQEKLLVYEFQHNGSLFKLIHEPQNGQVLDWGSRLGIAAIIAQALAFMHEELRDNGIAHGNLKSTNILFNNDLEPCISEYGLMVVENDQDQSVEFSIDSIRSSHLPTTARRYSAFNVDIYSFGVILLELLTGKIVQDGALNDLGRWVHSVVSEEWTVEVFDKALLSEGASEERMVNLLMVALKCINPSPEARPSMGQVAAMINSIREEEEKSLGSEL